MNKLVICAATIVFLAACGGDNAPAPSITEVSDANLTGNRGQVLSSIQVPGYTYIEVRNSGGTVWLAGTPVEVEEGEVIGWGQAAVMRNFRSSALDRVFEEILFVSGVYQGDVVPPHAASTAPATQNLGTVLSTQTAAGYSYIEVESSAGTIVWLAAPQTDVTVGQQIAWHGASRMTNFSSPSLGRTFPEILFVSGVK
ncbi:MAG: hypothetical protein OEZ11_06210 [Gammaproteobacteria bacterium]|nr:hypothetical protein [Gammaproteobacteria bacterium]